jgi:hypothetical protein
MATSDVSSKTNPRGLVTQALHGDSLHLATSPTDDIAEEDRPTGVVMRCAEDFDIDSIDIVVKTRLHTDHCGGNHLLPLTADLRPAQRARRRPTARRTTRLASGSTPPALHYMPIDGELELLPGARLLPAPGPTPGSQIVVFQTEGRAVVICGDAAVWFGELDEPSTEGQRRIRSLIPNRSGSRTRTSRGEPHRKIDRPPDALAWSYRPHPHRDPHAQPIRIARRVNPLSP